MVGGVPIDPYVGCEPQGAGVLCQSRCGPAPNWMFANTRLEISFKVEEYLDTLKTGFVPFVPPVELMTYRWDSPT